MEDHRFSNGNGHGAVSPTLRDLLAIGFRRRRLVVLSFLVIFLGAVGAAFLGGSKYQAEMKILVRHERVDPVVTTEANAVGVTQPAVTEEEMNSEVELIQSRDLLEQVVVTCGLHEAQPHFWSSWFADSSEPEAMRIARAVRKLGQDLKVDPVRKSDLLQVSYASPNPELSARVLTTLGNLYLAKHLSIHRPPGEFSFFEQQAENYRRGLAQAEERLASFGRETGGVAALTERDIALQKVNDLDVTLGQDQAAIAATEARIKALETQLAATPARLNTQVRTADNSQLLEQLKSTLLTLELKRTELLGKFDPSYPPVKEIEAQIAQTRAAIDEAQKTPVRENTTDQNPTYQWVSGELAKAKADLPTLQASAATTGRLVHAYREKVMSLDQKGLEQQDLIRSAKAEEANYLLYLNKREEARIADALDNKRISNVVIAEAATVPALPLHSPWTIVLLGGLLGILVSAGLAFASEYLDPSFRTPDEVSELLDLPVFASIPKNGH